MSSVATLTPGQARRIAIAAQGVHRPRPARVGVRQLDRVITGLQVVQIDSVNVLARSHYLPFFSRLGGYDRALLDRARDGTGEDTVGDRRVLECWAHEASLVTPRVWALLAFRQETARGSARSGSVVQRHLDLLEAVHRVVLEHGPLTSRGVEQRLPHGAGSDGLHWGWNWSAVKQCLEHLFRVGDLISAGRTVQFERRYAVPAQVLGADLLADRERWRREDPQEAVTQLLHLSLQAHGLGSRRCLADYVRLSGERVDAGLAELERRGLAEPVVVRGWDRQVWRDPAAARPRQVSGAALLSPFDSLVWQRERVEALWRFRYRLEIYVPRERRVHGYYVLPFLLDDALVGRVDLKADRARGVLLVQALHWEPGTDLARALPALGGELEAMAGWLGLARVDFAEP